MYCPRNTIAFVFRFPPHGAIRASTSRNRTRGPLIRYRPRGERLIEKLSTESDGSPAVRLSEHRTERHICRGVITISCAE